MARREPKLIKRFARLFGAHYCMICGEKAVRFRPENRQRYRYRCPRESRHAAILADQRKRRGKSRSGSRGGNSGSGKGNILRAIAARRRMGRKSRR